MSCPRPLVGLVCGFCISAFSSELCDIVLGLGCTDLIRCIVLLCDSVRSPVDGQPMQGVDSVRIHGATDYQGSNHTIRWTELFFLHRGDDADTQLSDPLDTTRLADQIAQAFCLALTPHLETLAFESLTRIGLRITVGTEQVVETKYGAIQQHSV